MRYTGTGNSIGSSCSRCARIYGLLGLAAKKGSVISGSDACEGALKKGIGSLLILAGDSSANTKERFFRIVQKALPADKTVEYVIFGNCFELGRRIGRGERSVMIVTDFGLSRGIFELLALPPENNTGV